MYDTEQLNPLIRLKEVNIGDDSRCEIKKQVTFNKNLNWLNITAEKIKITGAVESLYRYFFIETRSNAYESLLSRDRKAYLSVRIMDFKNIYDYGDLRLKIEIYR